MLKAKQQQPQPACIKKVKLPGKPVCLRETVPFTHEVNIYEKNNLTVRGRKELHDAVYFFFISIKCCVVFNAQFQVGNDCSFFSQFVVDIQLSFGIAFEMFQ